MLGTMMMALVLAAGAPGRAAEPGQTKWDLASFTWVQRVPAERGAAANAQPASLAKEVLQASLGSVRVSIDGQDEPLFSADELAPLAKALSEAFSLARPDEDLILLSTNRRGHGFMAPAQGVTARLFVRGGTLNLIVHDARLDFMDRYFAEHTLPAFEYGSRTASSTVNLQAPGVAHLRGDWLALPLAAPAPATAVQPPPPPAAAPAPEATAGPRNAAFYEAQTQRLKALKRLRDDNLISEAEYQAKREAILKSF